MINKNLASLLQRHPQLKNFLEKGNFLTGYTNGGVNGQTVDVFIFRCSWKHFCVQATAIELLTPGEVLVVTDSSLGNFANDWTAYSLKDEKRTSTRQTLLSGNSKNRSNSNITSFAVEIAQQQHRNQSVSSRI